MNFKGLFRKKLSIKQGEELLMEYCKENGFNNNSTTWKEPSYNTQWFAYSKKSNTMKVNNYVAYHPFRENNKYSVWIDLITGEIREVLRE